MKIDQHPLPGHGHRSPWGVMLHTTGGGVPDKAVDDGVGPMEAALEVYRGMKEGPGYVIAPDGGIAQLRQDDEIAWHCGVTAVHRRDFLTGHWEALVDSSVRTWWKARWPGVFSPQHLYPSESPNSDYIGIELVPCGTFRKNRKPEFGTPLGGANGRFTGAQYTAAALLALTLCRRHSIDLRARGRVLGHEDVNPVTRPGWDPGDMRGTWSWQTFWGIVDGLEKHA